ncbi:hypothetical protein [Mucilaginibacter celer]|uniref:Uncharacterized protein n=1 Tax=Mucilaginibacter celer TaxID=2305508 RepID=A0A494VKL0_9SPHI|nr:hypothetical protein [Mucilaginibacter celer]AYL94519.1 hypothetical protein HYN43_004035 [Mucilaginibacter celer]
MTLNLNYETLFEINIRHHYHLDDGDKLFDTLTADAQVNLLKRYDIGSFLYIVPTKATRAKFAGLHVVYKQTPTGIITGVPYTLDAGKEKPQLVPADNDVFSFNLSITDGLFANYSSLPLQAPAGMVYYFTNDPSYLPRVSPALTATPNVYKAATDYYPGDMLVDNQAAPTKLFIAQKKNNLDPAAGGTPAGNWITDTLVGGKPLAYAGNNDLIQQFGRIFIYQVTVAGKAPDLIIKDRLGNTVNVLTSMESGDLNIIKADMGDLPEGLYTAHLSTADASYKDDFAFYYSQDASAWAFIDICVKTGNAVYNLLQGDTTLKSPVFSLRFKNRATYWRYIGKTFGAASVSDNPLPLTRQGFLSVKVKDKDNKPTTVDLPNATASLIKPETNQIFSDIFF